ncbi:MAG: DUF4118 domain-containing protein [Solobacterium sp.]|nr:DUF4118 domain-containing protein [Solobacterium sp.]
MAHETKQTPVILLCLSASPSGRRLVHAASRCLQIPGSTGVALYIGRLTEDVKDRPQLRENLEAARQAGFEIQSLESSDIALSIAEYARRLGTTDLFIGRSGTPVFIQTTKPLSEVLTDTLPNVDIHVIPDSLSADVSLFKRRSTRFHLNFKDTGLVLFFMAAATVLCLFIDRSRFSNANIITIYILAVLIASLWTSHTFYGIFAAILYILLFNFLFIDPRFTLLVYDPEYMMTYFVTVLAALITGSLAASVKTIARKSAENAYQAKVLLDTSKQLEQAQSSDDIIRVTGTQLSSLLNRTVLFLQEEEEPFCFGTDSIQLTEQEQEAVQWTMDNRRFSGALTPQFSSCRCQYLSVHSDHECYGVIGVDMSEGPLSEFEATVFHSIVHEFTMALDNRKMLRERQQAEIAAEKEHMRAALLRSVSHDLRTPLTSIYGNASNLAENSSLFTSEEKQKIYDDIREDSLWLIDQMENILSVTRLETDPHIHLSFESIEDVIEESLRHIGEHNSRIHVTLPDAPLFAEMDSRLICQVLINLLSNAFKYTPQDSPIEIKAEKKDGRVYVSVSDEGPGIPDEEKKNVFDLFYTGTKTASDSARSMGIGLNVCAMIMKAHGSSIEVYDNSPQGSVFRFSLAAKEAEAYE